MTSILVEPHDVPSPRRVADLHPEVAALRSATLTALALDPSSSVVATGHQAAIWHAGILAKDLAVTALATAWSTSGHASARIHYLADHDANDVGLLRLPTRDGEGRLVATSWRWCPPPGDRASRDRAAVTPTRPPAVEPALPALAERIESMHASLARHADAPSLAWQAGLATASLAGTRGGDIPRRSMSALLELPVGEALLERLRQDPEACVDAHDAAIEADRDARARAGRRPRGVASLLSRGREVELPMWVATPEGRRPATVTDLDTPDRLRPRALLATALARLGGCDLFVHGTGGGRYDRVMEDWLARWLGTAIATSLAPTVVVSATCRLPLPVEPLEAPITETDLHRLRFDPDLGLDRTDRRRAGLLAEIDAAPRRSADRRDAYQRLHEAIAEARRRGAAILEEASIRLASQARRRAEHDLAADRTWAFPLLEPRDLDEIAASIRAVMSD